MNDFYLYYNAYKPDCFASKPMLYFKAKTELPRDVRNSKSPEKRQVLERLVSTIEYLQVPKWDRTRCPEELASSVGMPYPLQMFYGNLSQLGKKSNSVIRARSVIGSKSGVMSDQWRVSL